MTHTVSSCIFQNCIALDIITTLHTQILAHHILHDNNTTFTVNDFFDKCARSCCLASLPPSTKTIAVDWSHMFIQFIRYYVVCINKLDSANVVAPPKTIIFPWIQERPCVWWRPLSSHTHTVSPFPHQSPCCGVFQ